MGTVPPAANGAVHVATGPSVGVAKRRRAGKASEHGIVPQLRNLPEAFDASTVDPLVDLLDSFPYLTPGCESCSWTKAKDTKHMAPPGMDVQFKKFSAEIFARFTAWGIVGDLQRDDDGWQALSSLLKAAGIARPAPTGCAAMIRWLVGALARHLTAQI